MTICRDCRFGFEPSREDLQIEIDEDGGEVVSVTCPKCGAYCEEYDKDSGRET